MATQLDERIFYLGLEYGITKPNMNAIVNEVISTNEQLLVNTKDRDGLIYDLIVARLTGANKEAETTKEQVEAKEADTNNNEFRKIPLPAHNKVLRDKKFKYNTFASLMASSNKNLGDVKVMEFSNYLYDNKIDEVIEFINATNSKPISKRTLNSHIKSIIDSGFDLIELQNTPNGLVYKLRAEIDGGYYVTIPFIQLKELLLSTNKNMLKLYVLLKDECNETSFRAIDRGYLTRGIGLSSKADVTLKVVGTMVRSLANLGFIEIKETVKKEVSEQDPNKIQVKTINSYRICTLDEYLEAKNRGIIKTTSKSN